MGERRASAGPPSSSSSWHRRWAATSKRPSPPKAASHLEPDDDKENDDDRRPGKSSALDDRGARAAFDFVAAVSSDARAFLARQKPNRRSSRAVSTSPESSSDAAPGRGGGRETKRWNGSTILDPNAWPCAAPTDGRLHANLGENPGKRDDDDDDDGCARRSNGRSNGRKSRSTRLTLRAEESEASWRVPRRAWSADADPRACAAGLGETESAANRGIKNDREVISRETPGSRPTGGGRAAPAWAVYRAEASHECRRKSKSAHAGSRHTKRPDWNSDVFTNPGARQGTPVRGLRQRVGEWRARCETLELENESLREATRAARSDAEASEAEVRALIAKVSALEGELERRKGARDATTTTPPTTTTVSGNGSDSTSPFSGSWSPPPVHASLASSVDDSPPARMAGFVARGNERGNFARAERGSPGSAGSLVGESRGVVPEPPSPVLFALDDEEEEDDEEEAMLAADVDSVVDDLVAFAADDAEAFADETLPTRRSPSPSPPRRRARDEAHATGDSPDAIPAVHDRSTTTVSGNGSDLVPCAACADRAARLDAAVAEKDELVSAAAASAALAREYRARMHHARLDRDGDGYVGLDELLRHELFASYSQAVVERIHAFFPYGDRGKHGSLDEHDFVKLTSWTEDRTTRDAQRFWFAIVDVDGDGVVGAHDVKWLYDSIWKGDAGSCVSLEDLVCQIADMTGARCRSGAGRGDAGDSTRSASTAPRFAPRPPGSAASRVPTRVPSQSPRKAAVVGPSLADLRRCGLAPGVFGLLVNHGDMLLRRSTAEFSDRDVPM